MVLEKLPYMLRRDHKKMPNGKHPHLYLGFGAIWMSNGEHFPSPIPLLAPKAFTYMRSIFHLTFHYDPFQAPCNFAP
jgi:hypothetical protein